MLGALFLVMGVSLAGVKTGVDKRVHVLAIALLGLFIGSRIQAQELLGLLQWYPSVITMLVYMVFMLAGGYGIFQRAGVGRVSAMFCAYPGSMNSALVLAEGDGGDLRWIAISHSLRLVTVVSGAALANAGLGYSLPVWMVFGAFFTELSFVAVLLALIPGGVGEMAVIATVMNIDPVYVVSHHILRLLILIFMTPVMVRLASTVK